MNSLEDFKYPYSQEFKLISIPSDEQLQDLCNDVRMRVNGLVSADPVVSVVFPAYNEEMYLPLMLWSLSKLNPTIPIEIIGVNNASSDRTGEIIQQCGIIRVDESRKGVSYARQTGLEVAKGEYIATTDSDTQVPATWIDANYQYFNTPNIACFSAGVTFTSPHFSYYLAREAYRIMKKVISSSNGDITSVQSWPGANTFYRRDIALHSGGYELGSDVGEDNRIARSIKKYGEIVRLEQINPMATVVSSSRRLGSFRKVMQHSIDRLTRLGLDYNKTHSGMTFTDIR